MSNALKVSLDKGLGRKRSIVVIEDERDLADMLVFNLDRAGYHAEAAYDGRSGFDRVVADPPDLLVLDLMLPELSGTEVAARLRRTPATASIPIVMLTAKVEESDQIGGLAAGADDYITKPFSIKVLLARIEALLRRAAPSTADLRLGPIRINPESHEVVCDGQPVHLTLTEFKILSSLIAARGKVLTRQSLMTRAMGPGITVTERTIDVHVTAIRKKLGEGGGLIRTVRGVGYRAAERAEAGDE